MLPKVAWQVNYMYTFAELEHFSYVHVDRWKFPKKHLCVLIGHAFHLWSFYRFTESEHTFVIDS